MFGFSSEGMSLTQLKKHFTYAGEAIQEAFVAGLERGRQGKRASGVLRYQSVLRLLISGQSMLSLLEMVDLLRTRKHPHFKPKQWNRRQGWRDGEQLGRLVLKSTQQGLGAALAFALSCDESTGKGMLAKWSCMCISCRIGCVKASFWLLWTWSCQPRV
jgi:hypothetical protein